MIMICLPKIQTHAMTRNFRTSFKKGIWYFGLELLGHRKHLKPGIFKAGVVQKTQDLWAA